MSFDELLLALKKVNWKQLAQHLRVSKHTIDSIEKANKEKKGQSMAEIIWWWMTVHDEASWKDLAHSLSRAGYSHEANFISKYKSSSYVNADFSYYVFG